MAPTSAPTFTFVHAADLHLDTPFKGVHDVAPFVAHALQEASLRAFDNIVDLAISCDAAFVVFGGDIYDGAERGLRAQLRFRDGLGRLARHGIVSFVVHGNHDPLLTGWSAISGSWPDGVTIFGSDNVEIVPVQRDGEQIATVQGISYATQATTENLSLRYGRPDEPGLHVGLLHCNVSGVATGYSDYSPCTLEDLRASQLDYFALGHIHQRRILNEGKAPSDPWVVYPGNSQARSPRRTEQEPKGAVVVHVEASRVMSVEFVPCDVIRFTFALCPIAEIDDLGQLEDRLHEIAADELDQAEGRSVLLRVQLNGRGPIHDDLRRPGILDELLVRLRESSGDADLFCWWDDIDDATQSEIDLNAVRGRGDFASDLLDLSDHLMADGIERHIVADDLVAADRAPWQGAYKQSLTTTISSKRILERATALAFDELSHEAP